MSSVTLLSQRNRTIKPIDQRYRPGKVVKERASRPMNLKLNQISSSAVEKVNSAARGNIVSLFDKLYPLHHKRCYNGYRF